MSYMDVTFKDLGKKRKERARETITEMWLDGYTAKEIAKKVRISPRSVATAMGNLARGLNLTKK